MGVSPDPSPFPGTNTTAPPLFFDSFAYPNGPLPAPWTTDSTGDTLLDVAGGVVEATPSDERGAAVLGIFAGTSTSDHWQLSATVNFHGVEALNKQFVMGWGNENTGPINEIVIILNSGTGGGNATIFVNAADGTSNNAVITLASPSSNHLVTLRHETSPSRLIAAIDGVDKVSLTANPAGVIDQFVIQWNLDAVAANPTTSNVTVTSHP